MESFEEVVLAQCTHLAVTQALLPRTVHLRAYHLTTMSFSCLLSLHQISSVQLLSCIQLLVTPWTAAHQASLSITNSQSLLKLMSIKSVMPSNHLNLSCPLLLPPSIIPSIRVFSSESVLRIRWPKVLEFQLQHQSFQ